jgi:iron(III) transport system substrate-binding protein
MTRISWMVRAAACMFALTGLSNALRAADYPAPSDTAALYEGAKKEGTVVWYVSGSLETMNQLGTAFSQKYPGVKVQALRFVGVAQYQRFMQETEAHKYIADVLSLSDEPSMADLISQKYIADWKVPTHDRIPPDMRIGTSAYSPSPNASVVIYNTNKVTPEEVKLLSTWKGLLDPRFKGRMATSSQKAGSSYAPIHMMLDPKLTAQYGPEYLQALAGQKLVVYNDVAVVLDRVAVGENDIGIFLGEFGGVVPVYLSGAPVRWTSPKPTPVWGSGWEGISAFAPHPYSARLFHDWLLSDDGAKAIQTIYGTGANLIGAPDERAVAKESWYQPATDKYVPDWDRWSNDYDKDMTNWIKMLQAGH